MRNLTTILTKTLIASLGALALCGLAAAQTLTVSAAASLADALREASAGFEAQHPGLQLRLNSGASGLLLQQIAQGAPVDVFVSADVNTVDLGVRRKLLLPLGRRDIAANTVVLVVPAADSRIETLSDLGKVQVRRIAIGKTATVPAGRYARQALDAKRLWPQVQDKVVPADNVRQVLDYVARGEVDAGFVYATDVARQSDKVRVVLTAQDHLPVRYPAALVATSAQAELAHAYIAYLLSPAAQAVLARHGFTPP